MKLEEILTSLILSTISFFGWSFDEYKKALPEIVETLETKTGVLVEKTDSLISNITPTTTPKTKQTSFPRQPTKLTSPTPTNQTPVATPKPIQTTNPLPTKPKAPLPTVTVTSPAEETNLSVEAKIKSAVANIFCTEIKGSQIQKTTGSAVAISNNGVLLTNAHVAEHLLIANTLTNKTKTCTIRTGSPASKAYNAKVVYLPTNWVYANQDNLKYSAVSGTGENDFALIVLTEKISGSSASNLSFIEPVEKTMQTRDPIILSGYPAFGGNILDNGLYNILQTSTVTDVWPLNTSTSDLGGTGPTLLATNGSSGGAVTDKNGKLIGIMVATTLDKQTSKPNIRFVSYHYIAQNIKKQTGKSIEYFIANAEDEADKFVSGEGLRLANLLLGR